MVGIPVPSMYSAVLAERVFAAGVKSGEKMPIAAFVLADVPQRTDLSPEMPSVVTGDPKADGDDPPTRPDVYAATFAGSVAAGKSVAASCLRAASTRARRQRRADHDEGHRP